MEKKSSGRERIKSLMRAVVSAGKKSRVISTQCIKWWLLVAHLLWNDGWPVWVLFRLLSNIKAFVCFCSHILSISLQVGSQWQQIEAATDTLKGLWLIRAVRKICLIKSHHGKNYSNAYNLHHLALCTFLNPLWLYWGFDVNRKTCTWRLFFLSFMEG